MHHVFEVDEILRLVASSFTYENRKDAVSFACCCKSFSVPTLDAIWGQHQPDFTKLLQTLPSSAWIIRDGTFDFIREPSEEEWARLSAYAGRMRCFMGCEHPPSEEALKLLDARFSGRCMLPKLREIRWFSTHPEHLELMLPLIVSPVLTNFWLGFGTHEALDVFQVVPILEALAPTYNSLVQVYFCNHTVHDPRVIHAASDLLLKCNPDKLRCFHVISALSPEAFIHATQLPNLETFAIRTDTTDLDVTLPTATFPSLESLEIDAVNPHSPLLQIFTHIQSRAFTCFHLEFPAAMLETFLPMTLAALRPRGLHETLTELTITPDGDFDLDGAMIRPILFLNQLTVLEITLICPNDQCPYKLSDENLEELITAMPKLKQLSLGLAPCPQPADHTIKSLISIARRCKYLEHLIIHTNVEAIFTGMLQGNNREDDSTLGDPFSVFAGCPLRTITFGPCSTPNVERGAIIFALTLLRFFPCLDSVTAFAPTPEEGSLWEMIDGFVAAHRRIRVNVADTVANIEAN